MDDPLHGIVHHSADGTLSSLPLEEVSINVFVVDVSARVTLRQTFSNPTKSPTSRAKYVFPVPSRAAVCAFQMHFADGRIINGISKERTLAAEEHANALREGKASGLVEWVSDDVFTISIGSIPARQTVTAKLVFVMDLMDNELKDEVRLQLPMSVGSRYGPEPPSLATAVSASSHTRLRITVDVQMSGVIQNISSPTHPIKLAPYMTSTGQPSRRRLTAKFRSRDFLAGNFVLTMRAEGLDAPRCFAERDPMASSMIAMQLTLVPNIKLPPISTQEYLFVVDRSGSMSGSRIMAAKRALTMLLHMLHSTGTVFNIFSFGGNATSYWPSSKSYNEQSMKAATEHVADMAADYGGTELRSALEHVFSTRKLHTPTVVFVLTDGEIHFIDETIDTVYNAVNRSSPDAPLRVFSLGIGSEVSSAVIEGIARAGNGESLFAVESESIVGKCAKLLRAGRSSFVENISIDWGVEDTFQNVPAASRAPSSVAFSNPTSPRQPNRVELAPHPAIQQTPARITKIYPGTRFIVFMLTTYKELPKQVVLRGELNGDGGPIEIVVPVSSVKIFDNKKPDIPLVHTLAARHLITDMVEDTAVLPVSVNPDTPIEDVRKAAIVRLGEEYQLASRFTSFIAVDQGEENHRTVLKRIGERRSAPRRKSNQHLDASEDAQSKTSSGKSYVETILTFAMSAVSSVYTAATNTFTGSSARGRTVARRFPGNYSDSASSSSPSHLSDDDQDMDYDSTDTFSTMSSLEGYSSDQTPPRVRRRPKVTAEDAARMRSPSPLFNTIPSPEYQGQDNSLGAGPSSSVPPVPPPVIDLVLLQSFDGSFSLTHSFGKIVGQHALEKPVDLHGDDTAWATALAVAFLQKHLDQTGQSDLLDGLLDKIMEYIEKETISKASFNLLVERAQGLVA